MLFKRPERWQMEQSSDLLIEWIAFELAADSARAPGYETVVHGSHWPMDL